MLNLQEFPSDVMKRVSFYYNSQPRVHDGSSCPFNSQDLVRSFTRSCPNSCLANLSCNCLQILKYRNDVLVLELFTPSCMVERGAPDYHGHQCKSCGWCPEFVECHIRYGNDGCSVIRDKYELSFDEDGDIHYRKWADGPDGAFQIYYI